MQGESGMEGEGLNRSGGNGLHAGRNKSRLSFLPGR